MSEISRIWMPQPGPQTLVVRCHVAQDILLAGTRGWGKTDAVLGDWLYHLLRYKEHACGLFVRPTFPELEHAMIRAQHLYRDIADWNEQKKMFKFHGGGIFRFRHLRTRKDAEAHQGDGNTWINIEEAGNYPDPTIPDLLWGTLRSAKGVIPRYLMTANPGGPGHNWLKSRYIDPAPPRTPFSAVVELGDRTFQTRRIVIPGRLSDNKILTRNDPGYVNRLAVAAGGQEWLLRAWLDGDWDITAGGMFDDVWRRDIHVIKPFEVPAAWKIYRAFDWGSSKPFSVGWWAVSDGAEVVLRGGARRSFYPGSFIRVGELYGWDGKPNVGVRMSDIDIAERIIAYERKMGWKVSDGPADSSIFTVENGRSIADLYRPFGIKWKAADKSPGSRVAGWRRLRDFMQASLDSHMERPGMFIFETCTEFNRTVPVLPRDDRNLDDVDTTAEDHIGDEARYMLGFKLNKIKTLRIGGI